MTARPPRRPEAAAPAPSARAIRWWLGLAGLFGFGFGLVSAQRPFGDAVLAHPLIVYGVVCGAALLVLRAVTGRPVPEILPERILLAGFALGVFLFVAGDFLAPFVSAR